MIEALRKLIKRALRFQLSLRDIEEMLFERGIVVSYESIRMLARQVRRKLRTPRQGRAPQAGIDLALDEMFVTLRGEPYPLWRAVDQHGGGLDSSLVPSARPFA